MHERAVLRERAAPCVNAFGLLAPISFFLWFVRAGGSRIGNCHTDGGGRARTDRGCRAAKMTTVAG